MVRDYPKELLTGLCMSVLWAVGPYALIIFMPIYVQKSLGFSSSQAFVAALVGNLFLIGGCVFSGTLSDRYGRRNVLRAAALLLLIAVYPLMMWLKVSHTQTTLIVVQSLFCLMVAMYRSSAAARSTLRRP